MDSVGFAIKLLRRLDAAIAAGDAGIVSGQMADHAAYRHAAGIRIGLNRAREIVTDELGAEGREDLKHSV